MKEEPSTASPSARNLEFKATLLLVVMLLLVAGTVVYVLYARGAFEESQRLVLIADDSEGVTVGMDLTFSGFPVGRVRRIELAQDGVARIIIEVPRKDARWLRVSSVFTLTRGLLGNTALKAYSGILSDPPLPDGAERKVLVGDATAEIPRLVADMRELVSNLRALTAQDSSLSASLGNVRDLTEKLKGPQGALGALLGNEADAKKLITALDRANSLLARVDGLVAKVDAQALGPDGLVPEARAAIVQLNAALADARASLKKVDGILADAQVAAGNARDATADLAALRAEVDTSLRKVGRMIDEVNRRWPFAKDQKLKLP